MDQKSAVEKFKNDQEKGARRALLEELFNDYYKYRRSIYKMNFIRGIFFGLGSVLGGTVIIALFIWILSLFINFPVVGEYFEALRQSIDQSQGN